MRGTQGSRAGLFAFLVLSSAVLLAHPAKAADTCPVQVAYSPDGSAEELVVSAISGARQSIRLAAYSFTSPSVVRALMAAKQRGVDVAVIVDDKANHGKASVAALNLLTQAGIPSRTVSIYPIHHDKYIVIDGSQIETGSFNYSSAARRNSENAVLISQCPAVARSYLQHWQSRWTQGSDYVLPY
ncbi:phospholipase D family protein [Burkholderia stagnalis]|uniref:phospholipase D family nuclease n=1 Tax=Burkholderia stagnalis TaxID=1503054 RepID=UPI000753EBE2|nr:phospholipase D family protein [Burkholderia stagnalis]KVL85339.1 endonuclease [Burkholderia stagnalis]KVL91986.1 endonuclease [Burkholderia stagnalis]KVM06125.1 endonuclease [Burkholderia stagnalis]KVM89640.1 endonuclease [Burkholderia stagnalis]